MTQIKACDHCGGGVIRVSISGAQVHLNRTDAAFCSLTAGARTTPEENAR